MLWTLVNILYNATNTKQFALKKPTRAQIFTNLPRGRDAVAEEMELKKLRSNITKFAKY